MEYIKEKIIEIIPSCCDIGFLSINNCSNEEQDLIKEIQNNTNTIIILAHHVKTSLEWAWFPLESERNNNTCGADLHTKNVLENIKYSLKDLGYSSSFVPYPGKCGIKMKNFANKTNLGKIGNNYLFLHNKWGSWTHLRLLLTDAIINENHENKNNVCINCGKCIEACPAKAIENGNFNGIGCGDYQMSIWNGIENNYFWKCDECARVCPIGEPPISIKIIKN